MILDTAGRLHIDDDMMSELEEIIAKVAPAETLLVVDAMTGQDAVSIAKTFNERMEKAGYTAGVYANLNWWNHYLTGGDYDQWERWVAQYNTECTYDGDYCMWQCKSTGVIDGISGNVDMDLYYR